MSTHALVLTDSEAETLAGILDVVAKGSTVIDLAVVPGIWSHDVVSIRQKLDIPDALPGSAQPVPD
jgi:hypothetical protein